MEQQQKKGNTTKIILIIIILLLSGVIVYLISSNKQKTDQNEALQHEIAEKNDSLDKKILELEEMSLAYERMKQEYIELGKDTAELNEKLKNLNQYIYSLKKSNSRDMKRLNEELDKYKKDLLARDEEILALRAKVDTLNKKVDTLTLANRDMNDSLTNIRGERSELAQKVAVASVLKAENVKVSVVNTKGKVLEKDEYKSKDIHKVVLTFSLADNKVARKNDKMITMRMIEPSGSVVFETASEGGFFKNAEGKEMPYTQKQIITFTNTRQQVVFTYIKGNPYKIGTYTVELYAEGNKIGETTLVVK